MSDGRKRSRKSKLEVRTEAHFEESENTVLQTFTLPLLQSEKEPIVQYADHNYSMQQAQPPTSLPLHVSVEVEMEEFDESVIAAENKDITGSTHNMLSRFSSNPRLVDTGSATVPVFSINLDKMYKIADHIKWSSTNTADKHLGMELRNIWGRILYQKQTEDPYDTLIQKALQSWVQATVIRRCSNESPIFYQCHICELAWWFLHPFREHIKFHDIKKLKVYLRTHKKESVIVAGETVIKVFRYIPCEGDCHRCGKYFASHIRSDEIQYQCFQCRMVLETCSSFKQHQPICYKSLTPTLCRQKIYKCDICDAESLTRIDWDNHMRTIHIVRSDEPILISLKSCYHCGDTYHEIKTHSYLCLMSAIYGSCTYCYRKFPTAAQATTHSKFSDKFVCKVCGVLLAKKCMETEHMLKHTDKYKMAYRCVLPKCPPTTLFPDVQAVVKHIWLHHKKTINNRKNFCEKVLIPEPCAKLSLVQVDAKLECGSALRKELNSQTDVDEESSCYSQTEKQTDTMSLEYIQNNEESKDSPDEGAAKRIRSDKLEDHEQIPLEVSKVKVVVRNHEINADAAKELETIKVYAKPVKEKLTSIQDNPKAVTEEQVEVEGSYDIEDFAANNIELQQENVTEKPKVSGLDNSVAEDLEDEAMFDGYEQMLAKVFRVSDAVRNHKIDACAAAESGTVKVKIEPLEEMLDFEELIDIQDHPITIKEEQVETEGSYDINDMAATCDVKIEPQDEIDIEESLPSEMYEEQLINDIKMESELIDSNDYSILRTNPIEPSNTDFETSQTTGNVPLITVVKTEPGEHPELIEATDLQIMESSSVLPISNSQTDVEPNTAPEEIVDKKKKRKPYVKKKHILDPKELKDVDQLLRKRKRKSDYSKLYACTKCGYTNVHFLYRMHVKSNCGQVKRSCLCTKCNTSFSTMKSYLLHFEKHGYDVLTCRFCNETFDDVKDLAPHFFKHVSHSFVRFWKIDKRNEVSLKKHRCQTCSEEVAPKLFFEHWERHLVLNNVTVKVEPETTTEESDMPVNKNLLPPKILRQVLQQLRSEGRHRECGVCLRSFERRYDTKRHLIEHLLMDAYVRKDSTPSNGLKCQICFKEFILMEKYKFHMREHGGLPIYKCELCDRTFSDSSNFAKHKKIHSLTVLICDICNKKFHVKSQLEKHLMMHQTTAPIKCRYCTRQFFTQSLYKKHLKSKHERQSQFKCKVCDLIFDCFRDKMDHMWTTHKERKQVADCPYCKQEFRKFLEVKMHVKKVHSAALSFNTTARRKPTRRKAKSITQETFIVTSPI